jgi:hypothetical protein
LRSSRVSRARGHVFMFVLSLIKRFDSSPRLRDRGSQIPVVHHGCHRCTLLVMWAVLRRGIVFLLKRFQQFFKLGIRYRIIEPWICSGTKTIFCPSFGWTELRYIFRSIVFRGAWRSNRFLWLIRIYEQKYFYRLLHVHQGRHICLCQSPKSDSTAVLGCH